MRKLALQTLAILVTLSIFATPTLAGTVTQDKKVYILKQEELSFDSLKYKNDSKKDETITLTVSAYDAKTEKNLTDKPFVTLKKSTYKVPANKEIEIPYIVSIPKETPNGTYFNVVYIQRKEKTTQANVSIIQSIGVLLSFHVQDSTTSINQIFFNQSDIKIEVKKKGLPYISPTEFEYTYTNNSNFVFKPQGEIRILDSQDQQIVERYEINKEGKAIYPGESITQRYSINLWGDWKSILENRNIVSKTYSDIDQTPVLNKVSISILYQVVVIAAVAAILLIAGLLIVISSIVNVIKARKQTKPAA